MIYSNAIASVWEARLEQESYFALLVGSWKRRLFVHRFVHEEESSRIMKVFFESKEDAVDTIYLRYGTYHMKKGGGMMDAPTKTWILWIFLDQNHHHLRRLDSDGVSLTTMNSIGSVVCLFLISISCHDEVPWDIPSDSCVCRIRLGAFGAAGISTLLVN